MRWLWVGIALWVTPLAAEPSRALGARCKESCQRHLKDPRQRTVVCGRCLTDSTNDRGSWAAALKDEATRMDVLEDILKDDDWQVRWGAVRAMAATRGLTDMRELSRWIMDGRDNAPCLTALHLAASRKQTTGVMLQAAGSMGPSAAALCWQKRDELKKSLEVEMYATDAVTRREAMLHLATFFEIPPARAVLNAMATRPPATDEAAALLLVEDAFLGGPTAGTAVLSVAKEADKARVDRLLSVWAAALDTQRPKLKSAVPTERKEAVSAIAALGPLGARELEGLLEDPDTSIRHAAARGLARGEGMTLGLYAKAKLDPKNKVPNATRVRWAEFLGASEAEACEDTLKAAVGEARLDDGVRAAALAALGGCAGAKALPEVKKALGSKSVKQRAAAVEALGQIPRVAEATQLIEKAFKDLEPEVLAAAIRSAGAQHMTARVADVTSLLEHPAVEVRLASAQALVVMGDARSAAALGRALQKDTAAEVREACARGLGELGGPDAPGPLTHAAEKDASSRVKYVASESLRKLGFSRAAKE